jgi:hypothetical protein
LCIAAAAFMYNNCKALRAGKYSYDHLNQPALLGPAARARAPTQASQSQGQGQGQRPNGGAGSVAAAASTRGTSGGAGEQGVVGTRSGHSEGAIINFAVALSS